MKAMGMRTFGGPEVLEKLDPLRPEAGPGQVRVKVAMAGVNFMDVYMRAGDYAKSRAYPTPLPFVLGMEGAGTVDAVGEGVGDFQAGDRVAWCISPGAYAEYAVVPAWKLVPVPAGIDWPVATALQLQGATAHYLSHSLFPLQPGQACLVHAGAGGVGQLLIQLARIRGARVLATVGSEAKAGIVSGLGAEPILYREQDFREAVMTLTDGRGVDVVYDSVGRDTIAQSIRSVRRRGTCVMFGASSGRVDAIAPMSLAEAGSVFFTRPHLADYMQPQEVRDRARELFEHAGAGRLRVAIDAEFPLERLADAHGKLESRRSAGKLLIRV